MYDAGQITLFAVTIIIVWLCLFLLFRELNCWYFKINERLKIEKEILDTLKRIELNLSDKGKS